MRTDKLGKIAPRNVEAEKAHAESAAVAKESARGANGAKGAQHSTPVQTSAPNLDVVGGANSLVPVGDNHLNASKCASPFEVRLGNSGHGAGKNVLDARGIVAMGQAADRLVGGKNMNMARLNSIPGVRGAPFRAVTATAYRLHLDKNTIDPALADRFFTKLFAEADFHALSKAEKDFQQSFVLEQGHALGALAGAADKSDDVGTQKHAGARGAGGLAREPMTLREYIDHRIELARDTLAQPELPPEKRLQALRELSMSAQIAILAEPLPPALREDIAKAYHALCKEAGKKDLAVAVRSSAVGEDSADAAFAGAQDTYLNVVGADSVVLHVQRDFASGFNVRALEYRLSQIDKEMEEKGTSLERALEMFSFNNIDVSVTIQKMIKSEKAGTAFSIDPASGMDNVVAIDANFGYGESVVGGRVTPDNYLVSVNSDLVARTLGKKDMMVVDKPGGGTHEIDMPADKAHAWVLTDAEIKDITAQVKAAAKSYGCKIDTEFAIDAAGVHLVQARPETKFNLLDATSPGVIPMKRWEVVESKEKKGAKVVARGDGASTGAAVGTAHFITNIHDPKIFERFKKGDILVAERTDPDFLPFFKLAQAVLANVGGRTSHAAITSRELAIPAVIGVGDSEALKALDGKKITVDGSRGLVYEGALALEQKGEDLNVNDVKKLKTDTAIGLILADIDQAKLLSPLRAVPDFKVGLLRAEFVLGAIGVHYKALKAFDAGVLDEAIALAKQPGAADKRTQELGARIGNKDLAVSVTDRERLLYETLTVDHGAGLLASLESTRAGIAERLTGSGYATGHEFYVEMLSQKISLFAHAFDGKDVIYRTTDYKSNEYRGLLGGKLFEGEEDNPMLGYRGVSRGVDAWEIEAFVKARREYGAKNLHLMFPFVRTEEELMNTVATSAAQGLKRGEDGLKVFVMAEIPSVASIPHTFLQHVDGFSIGSNDMTQGVLMTDRDSAKLQHTYDEEDPAVVQSMLSVIFAARKVDKEVGFCGQGVSNSEFIAAMVSVAGIDSASVTPDAYVKVKRLVHEIEARKIGVAGLGAWMNEYREKKMNTVLASLVATNVFDAAGAGGARGAGAPKPNMKPAAAYDWLQGAMVQANTLALSSEASVAEKGRAQLAALRQTAKTVIYANTDWSQIVDTALRTAGFANAGECDVAIAQRRAAHAHG